MNKMLVKALVFVKVNTQKVSFESVHLQEWINKKLSKTTIRV